MKPKVKLGMGPFPIVEKGKYSNNNEFERLSLIAKKLHGDLNKHHQTKENENDHYA